ncbi:MAG TPA: translation initiation factor IF-2 [Ruminiclostridium sp.]|nr:translation initiation factor IF-2 [Ruminiclostridium sp.]
MVIKYRVHEVAKDLGVPSKDIIDFLAGYYKEPHKHMTALTEEELNLIFEHYSKEKAVENFDAYFASDTPPQAKKPAKPKTETEEETKAQQMPVTQKAPQAPAAAQNNKPAQEQTRTAAQPKAPNRDIKPAAEKVQPAEEQKQPQQKQFTPHAQGTDNRFNRGDRFNRQPNNQRPVQNTRQGDNRGNFRTGVQNQQRPQAQHTQPRPQAQNAQPFNITKPQNSPQKQHPGQNQPQKTKTGTVRYVNTRGAEVELDKYNEHYEEIAPQQAKKASVMQNKQKIKQKSQDRRPYYARRESDAEKLRRLQLEKQKKQPIKVSIPDEITVGELAARLKMTAATVIKKLMTLDVMASISDVIDYDTAALVSMELGAKVEKEIVVTIEDRLIDDSEDKAEDLKPRSPVVCVMGHVDHGKTSLLDAIRNTDVAAGEAGGITQAIGAYRVKIKGRDITFLDTPGHEAFTAMRARGAQITDIAVLVVAADDGIMPQTIEAINHAKAANVSIIVAVNKIDKPGANPDRVLQELTEQGLVPEEWGGETICVPVSAVKHENIDKLLEMILLVADMKELKANPDRAAKGAVIEARLDKGRGPVATMLVQNGTLHTGDVIIAGTTVGHIRVMSDEHGRQIESAGPSVPVEVTGLSEVPEAGDIFHAVQDERMARELVEQRRHQEKEEQFQSYQKVTLDNLFSQMQEGEIKELSLIVKADVQGSVEAVRQSLEKLSNEEVRVKVIHGGVGAISDNDVKLAEASNAIIIGFNVRPEADARNNAELAGVEMRMYRVIYDCIEEIRSAMKGMLAPKTREVQLGRVEARQIYKISSVGTIAGSYVLEGKITRASLIRVVRDGIVIAEDKISSLKRFKDDAKEVVQGYECGIGLEKFNDIKSGDIFEAYMIEEYRE